ncbi:MAG: hypothetical protein ACYS9X_12015, partial [Planctomycetota bacterium]
MLAGSRASLAATPDVERHQSHFSLRTTALFAKAMGAFSNLQAERFPGGRAVAVFKGWQVLSSINTGAWPVAMPLRRSGVLYATVSNRDGSEWSFPKPVPRPLSSWQGNPGLGLSPDGHAYLVYRYGAGGSRGGCFWSRTRDGETWSAPAPVTFGGERVQVSLLRTTPLVFAFDIVFTRDARAWAFAWEATGRELYVAWCQPGGFGDFSPLEKVATLPFSTPSVHDLGSSGREEPRVLASTGWAIRGGNSAVVIDRDERAETGWSATPLPVVRREDAPFRDVFGGWVTRDRYAASVIGAKEPAVIFMTSAGRLERSAAFTTFEEEKGAWRLPKPLAFDGFRGDGPAWIAFGDSVRGVVLNDVKTPRGMKWRLEVSEAMPWPPEDLSVLSRPEAAPLNVLADPLDELEAPVAGRAKIAICMPRNGFTFEVPREDETLPWGQKALPLLCMARVRPSEFGPRVIWLLDGVAVARGQV